MSPSIIQGSQQLLSRLAMFGWLCTIAATTATAEAPSTVNPEDPEAIQLFEDRIMPIFRSTKPSSCVQCHLASVDIKDYILPSHEQTFLALRDGGLIDLENPQQSKILTLIQMGDKDLDRGARLIHEKTREAEFGAFSAWIKACCADPDLVAKSKDVTSEKIGPEEPLEVVRHARKSRLTESFTRNIWSQRMRCFPCHTPHEINPDNPKHKLATKRHAEFVETYGKKMNIFGKTPEETVAHLIAGKHTPSRSGRYPMINLDHPAESLLVLKPTAKVPPKQDDGKIGKPSSSDPVSHMGGLKMHLNDQSYKSFIAWIEDYAAIVDGNYKTASDLPDDNWFPTQRVLRILDVPESWGPASTVQLFVHARDSKTGAWSDSPIAFTQGTITPRRIVNGALFIIRDSKDEPWVADSADGQPLAAGKYMIRAYVDSDKKIAESPALMLNESDFVGQAELDARWQFGFPKAEKLSAAGFTSP